MSKVGSLDRLDEVSLLEENEEDNPNKMLSVLRSRLMQAERRASEAELHRARVASLEKQVRELSWQVAMLAGPGGGGVTVGGVMGVPVGLIGGSSEVQGGSTLLPSHFPMQLNRPELGSLAGVIGWILRHRKMLIMGYLVLLHMLVYYSLTHGLFGALTHRTVVTHAGPCVSQILGSG